MNAECCLLYTSLWEVVINKVKPGDYVFIQFGHNDEKADEKRHTDPGSTYEDKKNKDIIFVVYNISSLQHGM